MPSWHERGNFTFNPLNFTFNPLNFTFNPLNTKLNPLCHLLALLGTHQILLISRIRVNFTHPASLSKGGTTDVICSIFYGGLAS
jgi:hypothetical protein